MLRHAVAILPALLAVACQGGAEEKKQAARSPDPQAAPAAAAPAAKKPAKAPLPEVTSVPAFEADALRIAGTPPRETSVRVSSQGRTKPTAYVVLGTKCSTTAKYMDRIVALEQRFSGKVDFIYLYPNRTDAPEAKRAFHGEHGFSGPMIDDQGAAITQQLRVGRTAEIVLAAPDGAILYRGAIDDSKDPSRVSREHAAIAIDEHLAGKPVTLPKTQGQA